MKGGKAASEDILYQTRSQLKYMDQIEKQNHKSTQTSVIL